MIPITLPRPLLFIALVLLALFPLTGSTFYIQLGAKILIMLMGVNHQAIDFTNRIVAQLRHSDTGEMESGLHPIRADDSSQ